MSQRCLHLSFFCGRATINHISPPTWPNTTNEVALESPRRARRHGTGGIGGSGDYGHEIGWAIARIKMNKIEVASAWRSSRRGKKPGGIANGCRRGGVSVQEAPPTTESVLFRCCFVRWRRRRAVVVVVVARRRPGNGLFSSEIQKLLSRSHRE